MGMRPIRVSRKLLLEGEDAATIKDGEEIVLVRWGLFKVTRKGDKLTAEFCEGADRSTFKKKKAIHWLAASPVQTTKDIVEGQCGHSQYGDVVPCTLIEYDYLLAKNKLDENDELDTPGVMTPVSKVETAAWADPMLKLISQGASLCMNRFSRRVSPDSLVDLRRRRDPVRAERFLPRRRRVPAADMQQRQDDVSATRIRTRRQAAAQGAVFSLAFGEEIG